MCLLLSQFASSLEVLVPPVAPADIEATVEDSDTKEEDGDSLWVALPVDDWVHPMIHIKEAEVVGEHVKESMPGHELPVSNEQLNISDVNVYPGHDKRCCMKDGHVSNEEVGFCVPG